MIITMSIVSPDCSRHILQPLDASQYEEFTSPLYLHNCGGQALGVTRFVFVTDHACSALQSFVVFTAVDTRL